MPAPMRPTGAIGRGAADSDFGKILAAFIAEKRQPAQVSPAVLAWERFRTLAERQGWAVELTPRGRTCCRKAGSVVFGPGSGTDYRNLLARIGHVDAYRAKWLRP